MLLFAIAALWYSSLLAASVFLTGIGHCVILRFCGIVIFFAFGGIGILNRNWSLCYSLHHEDTSSAHGIPWYSEYLYNLNHLSLSSFALPLFCSILSFCMFLCSSYHILALCIDSPIKILGCDHFDVSAKQVNLCADRSFEAIFSNSFGDCNLILT